MKNSLLRYTKVLSIVGDIIRIKASSLNKNTKARNGDLAIVEDGHEQSLAQIIKIVNDEVSLQVFSGTKGISTNARVSFLSSPMKIPYSQSIMGRIFNGSGEVIDGGPGLDEEPKIEIDGPPVNPVQRVMPSRMIRTNIPLIDVFNTLVESQKIPIFSTAGEPYNKLLARLAIQAEADTVVFCAMGLAFDDYHYFKSQFENAGISARTVMYINLASEPTVERLMIPDMALAVAENLATQEGKKVLVLLTDMTSYADAMKEIGVSMDKIPANRGYMGDLYSQLAKRYEKAADYQGAGSVTIISVTTMPGHDITHPVPDNTGYITEGQFYLHDGVLDPFGSLSRLKQLVIGKKTRDDHEQIMNTLIRLYSESVDTKQKEIMAFELSDYDKKILGFGNAFKENFMQLDISMSLEDALNKGWELLSIYFNPEEVLMKQSLIDKYWNKETNVIQKCEVSIND